MGIDDFYGSHFAKSTDLALGHTLKVTIEQYEPIHFKGDERPKLVLHFSSGRKPLVLNKTNADEIAKALGKDHTRWPGNEIGLYPTTTQLNGKSVDCIRVD